MPLWFSCSSEKREWGKAKSQDTVPWYEHFLSANPKSVYGDSAKFGLERLAFRQASIHVTVQSYRDFLRRYPDGYFKVEARSKLETLVNERHPSLRNVSSAKIIVEESYPNSSVSKEKVNLPFETIASRLLDCHGIQVVSDDFKNPDAVLRIKSQGKPLSTMYAWQSVGYPNAMFPGASLSGTIALECPDGSNIVKEFKYTIEPPSKLSSPSRYLSVNDAPFIGAFCGKPGGFQTTILEMFDEVFGYRCLINYLLRYYNRRETFAYDIRSMLLKRGLDIVGPSILALQISGDSAMVRNSAYLLADSKDSRAVEPLIQALTAYRSKASTPGDVEDTIRFSLEQITGQRFGHDRLRWKKWWAKNKNGSQND